MSDLTALAHRSQRAPRLFPSAQDEPVRVDGRSPPSEKIHLFRSLFAGRTDVRSDGFGSPLAACSSALSFSTGRTGQGRRPLAAVGENPPFPITLRWPNRCQI